MPFNIQFTFRGQPVWFPVLGALGFLGVLFFLVMVVLTHDYARIVGPIWIAIAIVIYVMYRRRKGYPLLKSLPRDWETATKQVLKAAEEFKSLEDYEAALAERDALERLRKR